MSENNEGKGVELTDDEMSTISEFHNAKTWANVSIEGIKAVLTARLSVQKAEFDRDFKNCNIERLKAQEELNQSRMREKVLMDDYKDYISKHSRCNNDPKV